METHEGEAVGVLGVVIPRYVHIANAQVLLDSPPEYARWLAGSLGRSSWRRAYLSQCGHELWLSITHGCEVSWSSVNWCWNSNTCIHLTYIRLPSVFPWMLYIMWIRDQFNFFVFEHPVFQAPFTGESILSPLCILDAYIEHTCIGLHLGHQVCSTGLHFSFYASKAIWVHIALYSSHNLESESVYLSFVLVSSECLLVVVDGSMKFLGLWVSMCIMPLMF